MKLSNAIKKLEKAGYTIAKTSISNKYTATKKDQRDYIQFCTQDDELIIIDLRRKGLDDDWTTDYHAGTYCQNLSQALRLITK